MKKQEKIKLPNCKECAHADVCRFEEILEDLSKKMDDLITYYDAEDTIFVEFLCSKGVPVSIRWMPAPQKE